MTINLRNNFQTIRRSFFLRKPNCRHIYRKLVKLLRHLLNLKHSFVGPYLCTILSLKVTLLLDEVKLSRIDALLVLFSELRWLWDILSLDVRPMQLTIFIWKLEKKKVLLIQVFPFNVKMLQQCIQYKEFCESHCFSNRIRFILNVKY